jgi:hypothetical protein
VENADEADAINSKQIAEFLQIVRKLNSFADLGIFYDVSLLSSSGGLMSGMGRNRTLAQAMFERPLWGKLPSVLDDRNGRKADVT